MKELQDGIYEVYNNGWFVVEKRRLYDGKGYKYFIHDDDITIKIYSGALIEMCKAILMNVDESENKESEE